MALNALRLRRALSLSSTILSRHDCHHHHLLSTANSTSSLLHNTPFPPSPQTPSTTFIARPQFPCRGFHATPLSLSSSSSKWANEDDKLDPNAILFEGCDYKHWLIVMDYPHNPAERPPPEQMVETYVQTLAQVVGSVEEAKRRMYACSTTTYTGFQAEIDEETSKKFEGMPGVLFVLPDSYIDPVNKEYGGDKYINGTIIPRPPPVKYGRMKGNRHNDQRPRGPMPNEEGHSNYNHHGPMSGDGSGRGNVPQQYQQRHPPQQNYGTPGQGERGNLPGDGRGYMPHQGSPQQQGFTPQQNYGPPEQGVRGMPGDGRGYMPQRGPPQQQSFPPQQNYGQPGQGQRSIPTDHYPSGGRDVDQGAGRNYMPSQQGNYNQGYNYPQGQTGYRPGDQRGYAPQGQMGPPGDHTNYTSSPPARGDYGQTGVGSFDQGGPRQHGPAPGGAYGQELGSAYGRGYTTDGENQRFSQPSDEQSNTISHEQRNYGVNQGRY